MKLFNKFMFYIFIVYIAIYPIMPTDKTKILDIILLLIFLCEIISIIFSKDTTTTIKTLFLKILKNKIMISIIFLNLLMYLSTFFAENKSISFTNSIRFSMYIFIFYLITYKYNKKNHISIIINTFITIASLSGIITLFQVLYTKSLGYKIDVSLRMPSFLENENNLGAYTILALFLIIALLIIAKNNYIKFIYCISIVLLLINIIFSQSRSALICLLLGSIIFAILYNKRLFIVSFFIPILIFIIPQSRLRILHIFDTSLNSSRFNIWNVTNCIIQKKPLLGIGYENFSSSYVNFVNSNPTYKINDTYIAYHPHNIFLKMQVELGILGTIAFLLFLIFTIMFFYKCIKNSSTQYKILNIGIATSLLSFFAMNMIDCYLSAPKVMITFFILLALANTLIIPNNE